VLIEMFQSAEGVAAESGGSGGAIGGGIVAVLTYVIYAISYSSIAKKTGHADIAWWAWVPILNLWLAFKIAGMGFLWFILTFVPVANLLAWLRLCLGTAKIRNKSAVLGVFAAVVPIIGFPIIAAGD
jgi:hypothetical protein